MENKSNDKNNIEFSAPVIKVIGLGGGGGNAVDRMVGLGYNIGKVEFVVANTDMQALNSNRADKKLMIGPALTHGLGSGGNPEVGENAALESEYAIREALTGADVVFLTAGMGGGTGSGSIAVAARIARELGAITISVVNTPFSFESGRRISNARKYLGKLAMYSDTLITIPNDQLLKISNKNISLKEAFEFADDVLRQGIIGITQLLTGYGEINVDFSHVRNMMQNGGGSLLSIGYGSGPDKVSQALYQALNHPLLEHLPIENATGIIANFTGSEDLSFSDVMDGLNYLQQLANNQADIVPGQIIDNTMGDTVQIILIITGIASTPIESIDSSRKEKTTSPQIYAQRSEKFRAPEPSYAQDMKIDSTSTEKPVEKELEPVMAISEKKKAVNDSKILPTSSVPGDLKVSPDAEAAYNTFMSPLGLAGTEPSSVNVMEDNLDIDSQSDLDIPTFIRRKM